MSIYKERSADPASQEMLSVAQSHGLETAWDRAASQEPLCGFGNLGICCRICLQGPCRIDPFGEGAKAGICGARDYSIVSRNLIRMIAGGTAAHSDHGRHVALTLLAYLDGHAPGYRIADPEKARRIAERLGIETGGKRVEEIVREVTIAALEDFSRLEEQPCTWVRSTVTGGRVRKFEECAIMPSNINGAIAEVMHRTLMGVDADPINLIFGGLKCALADYAGCHLSTDLTDIIFGTPRPVRSEANLGVIDPEKVNLAVHGHTPILSEIVVDVAREMEDEARAVGAKGINIVGICCTANELLMRKGVPLATNFISQELAIMTGALDAMVVDFQCIMPAIKTLSECFHTRIITTMPFSKIPGACHIEFREASAREDARAIVRVAIDAYKSRNPDKVHVPHIKSDVTAGFSLEAMLEIFSLVNRERPIRVLVDAIESGELRGMALFAGCTNTKAKQDEGHLTIARELAKHDVFIVATGCAAGAFAKAGYLSPEAVDKYAGEGLKRFLGRLNEAIDMGGSGDEGGNGNKSGSESENESGSRNVRLPLIFHMGSCVDNSRAVDLAVMVANEMGVDISDIPYVASAPEAMNEKAVSIGAWAVALGLPTHVGVIPPVYGSSLVTEVVTKIAEDVYGGYFIFDTDPVSSARKLIRKLDERRWRLKFTRGAAAGALYGAAGSSTDAAG
ncbi:MAG: anaerobic carbon-monoxide dehydrogenase catalytic subunit [Firmicutes bacterium]|nr:anaerobic carbon-monoxide dehydrogenase catalytic subunit [Bacillota bacterium]